MLCKLTRATVRRSFCHVLLWKLRWYMDMIIIQFTALIYMYANNNQFLLSFCVWHKNFCSYNMYKLQSNNWLSRVNPAHQYDTPFQWSESSTLWHTIIISVAHHFQWYSMTHHFSAHTWCVSSTHTISVVWIQHTNMTHHLWQGLGKRPLSRGWKYFILLLDRIKRRLSVRMIPRSPT